MRQGKTYLVTALQEVLDESIDFVVIQYKNLTAVKSRDFRNQVASVQGGFEVIKKTLLAKAIEKYGVQIAVKDWKGHIGVVFCSDRQILALTKRVHRYAQENEEAIRFVCGYIEGSVCSQKDVEALAVLPSKDELRSQLVSVLSMPMRNAVGVMQSVLQSLLYCLEQKVKISEE